MKMDFFFYIFSLCIATIIGLVMSNPNARQQDAHCITVFRRAKTQVDSLNIMLENNNCKLLIAEINKGK